MAEARKLNDLKEDFIRATKRVLISRDLSKNEATLESQLDDITNTYNEYISYCAHLWPRLISQDKLFLKTQLQFVRDKIKLCYDKLNCTYTLPTDLLQPIIPDKSEELKTDSDENTGKLEVLSNSTTEIDLNASSESQSDDLSNSLLLILEGKSLTETESEQNTDNMSHMNRVDFLKLAASQVNKSFAGDPLSLQSYVDSMELLESFATNDELKTTLITFALTKLEGKTREAIVGTPVSIEEIIESLKTKIKPDSSKVIEGKIHALRIDKMSLQDFSQKTDELAEAFRRALIIEGIPGGKAEEMTVAKTVEMCRNNARTDLVKSDLPHLTFLTTKR